MAEYAPKGVSYTGMVTGIVGAAGAVGNAVAEMMQARNRNQNRDPGDRPITRYDMEHIAENNALRQENTLLKAKEYTDSKVAEVRAVQAEQAVHNATVGGAIATIKGQVDALLGMTRMVIPNFNVSPGWGPAMVAPGIPPFPPVTPPTVSSGGTASTNTGTGT